MGKKSSKIQIDVGAALSRLLKIAVVALLVAVGLGMLQAAWVQLDAIGLPRGSARLWVWSGFLTYVGVHLILWRPEALFGFSHRLFSLVAVWLFGGQVTSVEETPSPGRGKKGASSTAAEGSPLVAFSPYVVPFYPLVVCLLVGLLRRWVASPVLALVGCWGVGFTLALHWIMTADDLQEQRDAWFFETYLLAVELILILTLALVTLGLPMVLPQFSWTEYLSAAAARIQGILRFSRFVLFGG